MKSDRVELRPGPQHCTHGFSPAARGLERSHARRLRDWVHALAAAVLVTAASPALAFPDRPITIVVPFSAGTTTDVNARDFAQVLSTVVKQTVTIDNRVGAEGTLGGMTLVNNPADGHTLMFTSNSLPVLDPLMKKNMPYDPVKDFAPVCTVARTSNVANITGSSPLKSAADIVAAAKADPGKITFAYASTTMRLGGELFQQTNGIKMTGVPYRSSVTALTDVAGGRVDLIFIDHVSAAPFYQNGTVRPVVVSGSQRFKALPGVPSADEAGVPGYRLLPWFGIYASAKTPPAVLAQVRAAVAEAVKAPATTANLEKRGLELMAVCGDAMAKQQQEEIEFWRAVLNKAGITPE
jgi:tripartite-type tricarboxylate transporter receptor subunit TctC